LSYQQERAGRPGIVNKKVLEVGISEECHRTGEILLQPSFQGDREPSHIAVLDEGSEKITGLS